MHIVDLRLAIPEPFLAQITPWSVVGPGALASYLDDEYRAA